MTQPSRRHCLARVKISALVCCGVLVLSAGAQESRLKSLPQGWHDVADIRQTAQSFARAQLANDDGSRDVRAQTVDARLRVRRCEQALQAYLPTGAALRDHGVVGVRCSGPVAWKLFIPIRITRRVQVAHIVSALPAGHRLRAGDIRWQQQVLRAHSNVLIRGQSDPAGQVLRHAVPDGQVLRPSMLRAADVVKRGDQVTLAVSGAALAIRMVGEALANGAVGERVRAKNRSSGRIVEGIVRAEGLVEINVF